MSTYKNLISLGAAAVLALGLAACGGGSGGPPPGTALSYSGLQTGTQTLTAGTYHVTGAAAAFNDAVDDQEPPVGGYTPGTVIQLGDLYAGCMGDANCTITDNDNGSFTTTGTIVVGGERATIVAAVTPEPEPGDTRAEKIVKLYAAASKADMDAKAAGKAAEAAQKTASEKSVKLDAISTMGESKTAMDNAQAVLDAKTAAGAAVTAAEAAQVDAEAAKTAAMALSDGDDKTALLAAIEAAITEAKAQVAAAKAFNTGTKLKNAVIAVTGTSTTKPTTPAAKGKEVATAVNDAFEPATGNVRVSQYLPDSAYNPADPPYTPPAKASTTATKAEVTVSKTGSTWAEIVGASNLMDMRVTSGANKTKAVKAASIAGMKLADVFKSTTTTPTATLPTGSDANGAETTTLTDVSINYMGIPGTVICGGTDCEETGGVLEGSWYFTPTHATAYYTANADGDGYDAENYARYGYWLTSGAGGVTVNTFAEVRSGGAVQGAGSGTAGLGTNDTLGPNATYSGKAAGMSVHKTFDADEQQIGIASGAFTADVSLTATFGDTNPSLKGEVKNFMGNAVDPAWKVTLAGTGDDATMTFSNEGTVTSGQARDGTGRTKKGDNGTWSATAYGGTNDANNNASKRPSVIVGNFDANFSDGSAAGAYATRKD